MHTHTQTSAGFIKEVKRDREKYLIPIHKKKKKTYEYKIQPQKYT